MAKMRKFIYILSFFVFRPLIYVLPFPLYFELIKIICYLTMPLFYKRREVAQKNLSLIVDFSTEQMDNVLGEGIKNIPLFGFLDFFMDQWTPTLCRRYMRVEGIEVLHNLLDEKKGVLLAFIHANNFNIVFHCIGYIKKLYCIVFLDRSNPISNLHVKIRGGMWENIKPMKFIYLNENDSISLTIRRLLKEGKLVALSTDGQQTGNFLYVPFFNKRLKLPLGIFRLGTLFQAPIIPFFSGFDWKDNVFRVWLGTPILCKTPEEAAEAYGAQFQKHLKKYPSHWTGWWRMELMKDEKNEEFFRIYSI